MARGATEQWGVHIWTHRDEEASGRAGAQEMPKPATKEQWLWMGQDEEDPLPEMQPGWCGDGLELSVTVCQEDESDDVEGTSGARAGAWPKGKAKAQAKSKALAKTKPTEADRGGND